MQTFLPYASFAASAAALDARRLGKQRVEVIQVVRGLTVPGYAWANHPAVLMWRGYEEALGRYGLAICEAWTARGYDDTCAATIVADLAVAGFTPLRTEAELAAADALPAWLTDDAVLASHRSALVRKDPELYRPLFPDVPDDLDYVWPVRSAAVVERERRQAELAEQRERRAAERVLVDQARERRRRTLAARRGWATRTQRAKPDPSDR